MWHCNVGFWAEDELVKGQAAFALQSPADFPCVRDVFSISLPLERGVRLLLVGLLLLLLQPITRVARGRNR